MKPEIAAKWEEAVSKFRNAEKLLNQEEFDLAVREAKRAFLAGFSAAACLWGKKETLRSDNLDVDTLSEYYASVHNLGNEAQIITGALSDFVKDIHHKHYSPREIVEKVRKGLQFFISISPPENKLPQL